MTERPSDPILEACGVPAAAILERCATLRGGGTWRRAGDGAAGLAAGRPAWRLVDFADLSDAEFVAAAHLALLGRPAYAREMARRSADLEAGMTRMEVIGRLLCSPEGRKARNRAIGGVALPALAGIARLLGPGAPRDAGGADLPSGSRVGRLSAVGDWFRGLRQLGRMRRELVALRRDLEDLRKGRPK